MGVTSFRESAFDHGSLSLGTIVEILGALH
jgi:hypothetical protein